MRDHHLDLDNFNYVYWNCFGELKINYYYNVTLVIRSKVGACLTFLLVVLASRSEAFSWFQFSKLSCFLSRAHFPSRSQFHFGFCFWILGIQFAPFYFQFGLVYFGFLISEVFLFSSAVGWRFTNSANCLNLEPTSESG